MIILLSRELRYACNCLNQSNLHVVKMKCILVLVLFHRQRKQYFKDVYNYLDVLSSLLIICVIPSRLCDSEVQWGVFAVGYIIWTFRSIKFLTVIRQVFSFRFTCFKIYCTCM